MSSLEDRSQAVEERIALDARYEKAKAEIERNREVEMGQAGALMFAAMAYGDTMKSTPMLVKAAHWAKLFCIASAFILPNLLFIRVAF